MLFTKTITIFSAITTATLLPQQAPLDPHTNAYQCSGGNLWQDSNFETIAPWYFTNQSVSGSGVSFQSIQRFYPPYNIPQTLNLTIGMAAGSSYSISLLQNASVIPDGGYQMNYTVYAWGTSPNGCQDKTCTYATCRVYYFVGPFSLFGVYSNLPIWPNQPKPYNFGRGSQNLASNVDDPSDAYAGMTFECESPADNPATVSIYLTAMSLQYCPPSDGVEKLEL